MVSAFRNGKNWQPGHFSADARQNLAYKNVKFLWKEVDLDRLEDKIENSVVVGLRHVCDFKEELNHVLLHQVFLGIACHDRGQVIPYYRGDEKSDIFIEVWEIEVVKDIAL